ncbi:MAG TPA: ScyD/ScyE family protein, partial [Niastella sp.]|nr:ScyD/ScyE family protein [Niastella sp.]
GSWQKTHPVANPPQDFAPEGTWYSMVNVGNAFYALDPNHGELVKVTTDGTIDRVVDFTKKYGHIVPTAIDYHGNFYVGNLGVFPIVDGSQNIYKVTPSGQVSLASLGFTTVLGVAFDKKDRMYVLESTTGNQFPTPGTGRIVRVDPKGSREVIATGFSNPTAITYGPDGNLYVSNWGFGGGQGKGEILKVWVSSHSNYLPD